MKKSVCLVLAIFLIPYIGFSQEKIPVQLSNVQLNINLLAPSIILEKSITENTSATFGFGLSPLHDYNEITGNEISINPFFRTSFRNYYPRKKVEKELKPNSGNYIAGVAGYYFGSIVNSSDYASFDQSNSYYVGAMWGMQRNYQSGIHLGFSIGSGFGAGENMNLKFVGVGEFELGFTIK